MAERAPTSVTRQDGVVRYEWLDLTISTTEEDTFTIPIPQMAWVVWMARGDPPTGTVQAWFQAEKDAVTTATEVRLDWTDSGGTGAAVKVNDLSTSGYHGTFARYCTLTQSGNMPMNVPPGVFTMRFNLSASPTVAALNIHVIPQA